MNIYNSIISVINNWVMF